MNIVCLIDRCLNKQLLPTLESYLLTTQNVHTNADISWGKIVLYVTMGKHNSSTAKFQGSVAFAEQRNEKMVSLEYCCIKRNELLTAATNRVYNMT